MKYIQILVLLCFANTYSQEEIDFKMAYQPNLTYSQTILTETNTKTMFLAAPEVLDRLKEKGMKNPEIRESRSTFKTINKTGKLKKNKFSLSIEFTESPTPDVIPVGTTIYGSVDVGEKPVFESMHSPGMDKEMKKIIFNSMQSILSQITFPEKKMKVGDSFLREMPLSIPMGNKVLKMGNTIIYKLIKIENGLAYFDIIQDYTFDTSLNDADLFASGKGTGELIYDIRNTYYLKYSLNSDLHYEMNHENLKAVAKSTSYYEQSTVISAGN